jgi:hypothetical protein
MPNNVWNRIQINAKTKKEQKQLAGFIEKSLAKEDCTTEGCSHPAYRVDFNLLIPMPEDLMDANAEPFATPEEMTEEAKARVEKYGYESWYTFGCTEWGTKWNAWDTEIKEINEKELDMSFITAWSYPVPWIEKISKKFPDLTIKYDINGEVEEAGEVIIKGAEVLEEKWIEQGWWGEPVDEELDMEDMEDALSEPVDE